MSYLKYLKIATATVLFTVGLNSAAYADEPIKVKVFIGSMFEIG